MRIRRALTMPAPIVPGCTCRAKSFPPPLDFLRERTQTTPTCTVLCARPKDLLRAAGEPVPCRTASSRSCARDPSAGGVDPVRTGSRRRLDQEINRGSRSSSYRIRKQNSHAEQQSSRELHDFSAALRENLLFLSPITVVEIGWEGCVPSLPHLESANGTCSPGDAEDVENCGDDNRCSLFSASPREPLPGWDGSPRSGRGSRARPRRCASPGPRHLPEPRWAVRAPAR